MNREHYHRLGDYIQLVDVRNRELTISNLLGVSIAKTFIPSIANTIGTDMSTYKIVEPYQFAYGPVTSRNGDKITFALYKGEEKCIVSSAYITFEIIDKEKLDPDYLMMWALRPEFDRYARFMSNGSAREIFSWDDMCDVYLPVPKIDVQRRVVAEYQAVESRIATNERLIEKLEDITQTIYKKMFVDDIDLEYLPDTWRLLPIDEVLSCKYGKGLSTENVTDHGVYPVYGAKGVIGYYSQKNVEDYVTLITSRGSGSGVVDRTHHKESFVTNNSFTVVANDGYSYMALPFVFSLCKSIDFVSICTGSAQPQLTNDSISLLKVLVPPKELVEFFCSKTQPLFDMIETLIRENECECSLKELLLSKMS
ncbi:MAG: restriction endonuclease subunit S [Bacteroidales bacterium]|nr:restriction endonuclease subunit S [Bacteroidales bacterium]